MKILLTIALVLLAIAFSPYIVAGLYFLRMVVAAGLR